ncbi:MAG: hypothetical protein OQJ99_09820 [Rhodospirillales bacterium]|nr:hypothetical protein [Rhodospirillales bacterium]MCW8862418.1 hypothetical protein [Rhodospirillales bacterium]MCW8953111.1 hypothetical protein [Rhodospirillales bacterium]MCW8969856.1 hypothetical protein [Rhodospirillales bacterium]MCW9001576.1 hypothetical protein [Rhodospirillales bacterium]
MNDLNPCYKVVVANARVTIHRIAPDSAEYHQATAEAVIRDRDVLEMMRKKKEAHAGLDGSAYFKTLEMAKDFALLNVEAFEEELETEYQEIHDYDGAKPSSID